jgi:hypothetical protein
MKDNTTLLRQALDALENLGRFDNDSSGIWKHFYASTQGDFVNLQEFREKSGPVINALRTRLNLCPACGSDTRLSHDSSHDIETFWRSCEDCDWRGDPE